MSIAVATAPNESVRAKRGGEPPLWFVVVIFWLAFAVAIVSTGLIDPHLFERQDPDSFLRLVQVRDFLAGQGWFDLVQHRMDPPGGALLHWSRLIDAPIAGMILLGNLFGDGERFALVAWPVLMLLGMMGAAASIGSTLAGRSGAVWSLVLALFFIDPLIVYLPGDLDHHNAQIALTMTAVALAMKIGSGVRFGFFAGCASAVTLAIGLEMLPYVAIIGAVIALQWAITGRHSHAVAAYGATLALLPADLFALAASPAASMACDSLSFAYTIPIAVAGFGLAGLALFEARLRGRAGRLGGVIAVAAAAAAVFIILSPGCLSGPYGLLSQELKEIWLRNVTEAQPFQAFALREPVGAFASFVPLIVAIVVAVMHLRPFAGEKRELWVLPTILLVAATALSFYQVRTLPFASAIAIPILGAWIAEIRIRSTARTTGPVMRALPVVAAFLAAIQVTYLLIGLWAVDVLDYVSDGRIKPHKGPEPPEDLVKELTVAQKNCFDPASGALFSSVPRGLVIAPLFYGPTVLMLSSHDVVGGPYHRNGKAILDTIHAMYGSDAEAKAIMDERGADYVAVCTVSKESAVVSSRAPDGLVANLIAGNVPPWLQPIEAPEKTGLKLWRIVRPG